MEQGFEYNSQDATAFINKIEVFFMESKHININFSMYVFGVKIGSYHYIMNGKYFDLTLPIKVILRDQWENEMLYRVQGGIDEHGGYAEDNDGLPEWEYAMRKTIEYQLPVWGIFYNIGRMQGYLNWGRITVDRFNEYYQMIPLNILTDISPDLKYLFEAFDERNLNAIIVASQNNRCIVVNQ
jgi:hypothetical protein